MVVNDGGISPFYLFLASYWFERNNVLESEGGRCSPPKWNRENNFKTREKALLNEKQYGDLVMQSSILFPLFDVKYSYNARERLSSL